MQNFSIKLEYGEGNIILDSHGGDTSIDLGERDNLLLEEDFVVNLAIAAENTNKIVSEGQIPFENLSLNSSDIKYGLRNIVRPSFVTVRATGDLALEDATVFNVLGFSGSGYIVNNDGDNIEFEGATGLTV